MTYTEKIIPFVFKFNLSIPFDVSERFDSVSNFISSFRDAKVEIYDNNETNNSILINEKLLNYNSSIVVEKFKDRKKRIPQEVFEKSILFIDLKDAPSDKYGDALIDYLSNWEKLKNNDKKTIVYFLVNEIAENTITVHKIRKMASENECVVNNFLFFDKNGNYLTKCGDDCLIKRNKKYVRFINNYCDSLIDDLKFSIIKFIGHFTTYNIYDQKERCQKYYYDICDNNDDALTKLMKELVEQYYKNILFDCIIYKDTLSNYLKKFCRKFNSILKIENDSLCISLNENINYIVQKKLANIGNVQNVLLITDMVHTGKTLNSFIRKLNSMQKDMNIFCISLFVSSKFVKRNSLKKKNYDKKNRITYGKYEGVSFIGLFERELLSRIEINTNNLNIESDTFCNMCRFNILNKTKIPVSDFLKNSCVLNSFEFYDICQNSGFKEEDYPRNIRRSNKWIIPDTLEIFKDNNVLLANKIDKSLNESKIYNDDSVLILFPVEDENKEIFELPAGMIAVSLKKFNSDYRYLGVPRKMINKIENCRSQKETNNILKKYSYESYVIENISGGSIVIIDEICFTGKTFDAISKILACFQRKPDCYFPLINFFPAIRKKLKNDVCRFMTLYEIDFYQ